MPNWQPCYPGYWGTLFNVTLDTNGDPIDFDFAPPGGSRQTFTAAEVLIDPPTHIVFADGNAGWLFFDPSVTIPGDWGTSRRITRRAVEGVYDERTYEQVQVDVINKDRRDAVVLEIASSGRQIVVDWDNEDREIWRHNPDTGIDPFDDLGSGAVDSGLACVHWWVLDSQLGDHSGIIKWPESLG